MDSVGPDLRQYIPRLPRAIQRPQLLGKLNTALRYRLTLISAPPGYGKTTIASQFATQAACPVVWHTVEERERDLPNLHDHCLCLLEPLSPSITASSPSSDSVPPSELAAHVADCLRHSRIGELIYLLDDVHSLDGFPSCEAWLRTLLLRLPKSCHMVLISRTLPNLPYVEMAAHNDILAIGPDDLRLTQEEIHTLAKEVCGESTFTSDMQSLLARLDGWPAGVFLAFQPLPASFTASMFGEGSVPEALFDSLAQLTLLAQPPDLHDFLLQSSVLPYLTVPLCKNILQLPNSAEYLAVAQTRNLFILNVAGNLQYHALFRNFLQAELCSAHPKRFADLHLRAARWFDEVDDVENAFRHYLAADRQDEAQRLAERTAPAFFGQGKFETMLDWSRQLHDAHILAPNLSLECAMVYTDRYEYEAADSELERASKGFYETKDKGGQARVQLQRAMIHLQCGRYAAALKLAQKFVTFEEDIQRGRALRIIGLSHLRLGDAVTAVKVLEEAVGLYRKAGLVSSLSHLLQDLHFAYFRLGKLDEMGSCLQEVVALRRKLRGVGALAFALNDLGFYYHRRSDFPEAFSTFEEGLRLIAGTTDRRVESFLLASLADLKRDLGLFASANTLYDQALQIARPEGDPGVYCAILNGLGTLRRWQGRLDEACSLAEAAMQVAAEHLLAVEAVIAETALWLTRGEKGDPAQALKRVRAAVEDLEERRAYYEMIEVLAGCARLADLCGDSEATGRYLKSASTLARGVGTAQTAAAVVMQYPSLDAIITHLPEAEQLKADLQKSREARAKLADEASASVSSAHRSTHGLKVLTLGQATVERDGRPVSIKDWQAASPRELFFYLLFNGPKSRYEIEPAFWPESGPDQARALFHTTLHRARSALGANVIVFEDESYFINPTLSVDCDVHHLESWTTQARLLPPHDARADDLWRKAATLYRGDFLHTFDAGWIVARREAYAAIYLDALVGLGRCARTRNDLSTAVEWFAKATAVDPYSESTYRQMIECYASMGERGKVQACFHHLAAILRDDLGIDPSDETLALVRSVTSRLS